jgi:glycosyltransferase involved in cell wall biosynthesis
VSRHHLALLGPGQDRMGGVRTWLDYIATSPVGQHHVFATGELRGAIARVRRERPETVVVHAASNWHMLPVLAGLRRLPNRPRIVIQENIYTASFEATQVPNRTRFRAMLRLSYACADTVVAVSAAQAAWICDAGLAARKKVTVICPTRRLDAFLGVPTRECSDRLVLGAYGRLTDGKGFEALIAAMARLSEDRFALRLAGTGELEAQLAAAARDLPHVELLGQTSDIPSFLAGVDAVVVPSRNEAFGYVCLEAKAAARPLVVTPVDSLPDHAAGCGVVCAGDRPQELADGIAALAHADVAALGVSARRQAATSEARFVTAWTSLLDTGTGDHVGTFTPTPLQEPAPEGGWETGVRDPIGPVGSSA